MAKKKQTNAKRAVRSPARVLSDITERKRAEERLAFQANILANITDVVYTTDEQLRLTSWNHAAEKTYGWKEEDVLGKNVIEVVNSKFDPESRAKLTQELSARESVTAEIEHRTRSGEVVLFESTTMLLRDTEGKATGFVSVNRDITERKQAEEALHKSEERYRLLFDNVADTIVLTDPEYNVLSWNPAAEKMYGWTATEAIGKSAGELMRPEYIARPLEQVEQILLEQGIWHDEVIHHRRDGTRFPVLASGSQVKDKSGKTIGYVAINRDITERKRAEEALRVSEERFRSILDNIEDGYYEVDTAGNFTFLNPALARMLGRPANELDVTKIS